MKREREIQHVTLAGGVTNLLLVGLKFAAVIHVVEAHLTLASGESKIVELTIRVQ